jgi:hypothetical protein
MRLSRFFVLASSFAVPLGALAGATGALTGRVLPPPNGRLIAKNVWVGDKPAAVAADGSFSMDGIPAGPAELAIETSEGLFVVTHPVAIAPGTTRRVQLAFGGRQGTSAPTPPEKDNKKERAGLWANPATATLIIIGSAIIVGLAIDQLTHTSSGAPASPSAD